VGAPATLLRRVVSRAPLNFKKSYGRRSVAADRGKMVRFGLGDAKTTPVVAFKGFEIAKRSQKAFCQTLFMKKSAASSFRTQTRLF
jgi:hypothetical protein